MGTGGVLFSQRRKGNDGTNPFGVVSGSGKYHPSNGCLSMKFCAVGGCFLCFQVSSATRENEEIGTVLRGASLAIFGWVCAEQFSRLLGDYNGKTMLVVDLFFFVFLPEKKTGPEQRLFFLSLMNAHIFRQSL